MVNVPLSYDYAVHSDFLIHWTGKDIDHEHQPTWYDDHHHSKTDKFVSDLYLRRLRDILTYGLWMTDEGDRKFRVGTHEITIPATPQCCFTELKLSESRSHAARYGRLGIGVKRPFLFRRFGRPLAYFGFGEQSHNDKFLEACLHDLTDKRLMNFFKPMNSNPRELTYELYTESEWRILFFDELVARRQIIDPRDSANEKEHAYFNSLTSERQNVLKYLIPLDGWFAIIIYPSLSVKNHAQWNAAYGIVEQTRRIKSNRGDHANRVEAREDPTWGNWPIELNLDSCRHF
jgi:Putative abortive phage resistance protein AbiGi, antitoxin